MTHVGYNAMSDELLAATAETTAQLHRAQAEVQRLAQLRQDQICKLRARGVSYQQIADRLEVTRSAVQQIVRRAT